MNKTELLSRFASSEDQRILLGRLLDRLEASRSRSVPTHSPFLSPAERAAGEKLLAAWGQPRHFFSGGYEGAERTVCFFPADWQEDGELPAGDSTHYPPSAPRFRPTRDSPHRMCWVLSWAWVSPVKPSAISSGGRRVCD